jgi:type IV secretory pathway VirB10-like protein
MTEETVKPPAEPVAEQAPEKPAERAPEPPKKVDPETLAIRVQPDRAIRFKRNAIVGLVAAGSLGVSAATWMALRPHSFHHVIEQDDATQPGGKVGSDTLSGLPANYGDIPKLGPPLPGDLGKPILEHQQSTLLVDAGQVQRVDQAVATERERDFAEQKSAHESSVLVHSGSSSEAASDMPATVTAEPGPAAGEGSKLALDPNGDPNAQQRKADFVSAQDKSGDINAYRLTAAPSPYLLSAGSVIAASLITGLRSDLPGLVTAQVTENVFDSPTGRILLIPQGARLVGSYDSVVAFGQSRALVVWQRIIMPDGSSLKIDNVPATDPSGYAGLSDKVDFHTFSLLKGVALSTLLGVGSELAMSGQGDLVQAIRQSTQDSLSRAGDQITSRNLQVQPTIAIRPGSVVRLVVHRDLVVAPWKGGGLHDQAD